MLHVLPTLGRSGELMRLGIIRIGELIDEVRTALFGNAHAHVLVILGMALADIRAREYHFCAERAQIENLFLAHLVRNHQHQAITLLRSRQRQTQSGVTGRRFDQCIAGLDVAASFRFGNHRYTNAIFD
jgi:hypothetical protein